MIKHIDLEGNETFAPVDLTGITSMKYSEMRIMEYPPMQDFIDAQVKKSSSDPSIQAAGIVQEKAYLDACLAVKAKYPKV